MMKAITGRIPEGYPAELDGFELCIQKWCELPEATRKYLKPPWNEKFRSYCVRPTLKPFRSVKGTVWQITREERRLIDNWELTGKWYQVYLLKFFKPQNQLTQIEIQVVNDDNIHEVVDGKDYRNFLNDRDMMYKVAQYVRYKYMKNRLH